MTTASLLVLGVDGGGTKTTAWLATPDTAGCRILGRGQAGPSNQRAAGIETALRHLDDAVALAFANAGLPPQPVARACLGLAGADRVSDRSVVEAWAQRRQLAAQVHVVNDALPLLYATERQHPTAGTGIALICGTGSMALGRKSTGETARSGGWGYLFGDEGSAFAIGRAGLQAAAKAADGRGPQTSLQMAMPQQLQLTSPAELVTGVYGSADARTVVASLADVVFRMAEQQDHVSQQILSDACIELALMVTALACRMDLQSSLTLYLTGGVILNQAAFRQQLLAAIAARGVQIETTTLVHDPVLGAVQMALSRL